VNHNKKIKVLQVTSGFRKGVSGGIPSVLHNYCTSPVFDDDEVGFDYLSLGYQTFEPYRKELEDYGGALYNLDIHVSGIKRLIYIFIRLRKFLKKHKYDIVHINSGALTQVLVSAMAAKSVGIKRIIAHSHNAIVKAKSREIIYNFLKPLFYLFADEYYACAEMAAASMFPNEILKKHKWIMIPNAIKIEKFKYNEKIRNQYREEYKLENKYVIGHVGRFNEQKNHTFLIDVFSEVFKRHDDAVLLLIGAGDLQDKVVDKVKTLGIDDKVIFMGQRKDANCFMQAMDVFAFPSLYEGLGMVLIEAQVSGLKIVSSDTVPYNETNVTDCIQYKPLGDVKAWVDAICTDNGEYKRYDRSKKITASGYELNAAAEKLKKIYMEG